MANNTKMNISYSIKAIDKFSKVHEKLERQLDRLNDSSRGLKDLNDSKLDVDTKQASKSVSSFDKKLKSLEVDVRMLNDLDLEMEGDASNALKEIERLRKGIKKVQTEIEVDVDMDDDKTAGKMLHIAELMDELERKSRRINNTDSKLDVELDMNTKSFYRKLKGIQVDMMMFDDTPIEVEADVDKAAKSLDRISNKVKRMQREIELEINADTRKTERELNSLNRALFRTNALAHELDNRTAEVDVKASTLRADSKLSRTHRLLERLKETVVIRVVTKGYKDARASISRVASAMRNLGEISMTAGIGSLIALIPALSPILATLAGGLGAVGSAFLAAGTGAAGFAAVAIPSISKVVKGYSDLKKARKKLDEATTSDQRKKALQEISRIEGQFNDVQTKTIHKMQEFTKWFSDFSGQFETPVLELFVRSMENVKTILELSQPAIESVLDAVQRLYDKFEQNLKADDVKAFFKWAGETAGPQLEKLVSAVGNFFVGLVNMFVAFDPLAQSFSDGLLDMSEKFRDWSSTLKNNRGFQNFMDYVKESAPKVLSTVGNLILLLIDFGIAMAPIGEKVLSVVNAIAKWTGKMIENHKWFRNIIGILPVAIGLFMMFATPLLILIGIFKNMWPLIKTVGRVVAWLFKPIGNLITKFGGLGGILSKVMPWIGRFGSKLLGFLGPVGVIISALLLLKDMFGITWAQIGDGIKNFWSWVVDFIPGPVKTLGKTIGKVFDFIGGKTKETTSKMKTDTSTALTGMNTDFSTNFESMFQTTNAKTGQMASTLSTRASAMANSTSTNLFDMKNSFLSNLSESDSFLNGKFSDMSSTVDTSMFDMSNAANLNLSDMSNDFSSYLSGMDTDTSSKFGNMSRSTDAKMAAMQKSVSMNMRMSQKITDQQTRAMQRITQTQMAMQKRAVQSNMKASHSAIVHGWNQSESFLSRVNLSGIGANIMHGLVRGISGVSVIGAVRSVASKIKGAFTSFFSIHSPSRLMDKDVGQFITLGVIDGILRYESKAEKAAETIAKAIRKPFDGMEVSGPKVSAARNDYENSRRVNVMTKDYGTRTEQNGSYNEPQYAVINIGGYEARGTIEHITAEQEREKRREKKFERGGR